MQRALLAMLLVHRGEAVSTDRLIEALWGGRDQPKDAAKSLQVHLSRLRKTLGDGRIETRGRGYLLHAGAHEVDAARFEEALRRGVELLAGGDARSAAAVMQDGLALWRGRPLEEFAYDEFAQAEIARLEESRLAGLEVRFEAELALGRQAALLPELEALVRQHPLRERLQALLMLALYRSGRQADALAAYTSARRMLIQELGIEPGRELQDLERAILRQDPALDLPRAPRRRGTGARSRRRLALVAGSLAGAVLVASSLIAIRETGGPARPARIAVPPDSVAVIDPKTNEITAAIPVGDGPARIAVGGGRVWVVNRDAQTISLLDARRRAHVRTFGIGATPADIAVGFGRAWVGDSVSHEVIELDGETGVLERRISAPPAPWPALREGTPRGGAVAVGFGSVWFASGSATLSRIDPTRSRVRRRIDHQGYGAADRPHVATGEGAVWVATCCNVVVRVDPRTTAVAATVPVPAAGQIAVGLGSVWLADTLGGTVWQLAPDSWAGENVLVGRIPVGRNPLDLAVGEGSLWVATGDGAVVRLDPTTGRVVRRILVGGSLAGIAVGEGAVWVSVD